MNECRCHFGGGLEPFRTYCLGEPQRRFLPLPSFQASPLPAFVEHLDIAGDVEYWCHNISVDKNKSVTLAPGAHRGVKTKTVVYVVPILSLHFSPISAGLMKSGLKTYHSLAQRVVCRRLCFSGPNERFGRPIISLFLFVARRIT